MRNTVFLSLLLYSTCCYAQNAHISAKHDTAHVGWQYEKPDTDKFTNEVSYYAYLINDGKVYHSTDYKGKAEISLQNTGGINIVSLNFFGKSVNKNANDSTVVSIGFDNEEMELYAFAFSSNASYSVVRDCAVANRIINKLKTAKKLKLHVTFADGEVGAYSFDVVGLTWNYPGKEKRNKRVIH